MWDWLGVINLEVRPNASSQQLEKIQFQEQILGWVGDAFLNKSETIFHAIYQNETSKNPFIIKWNVRLSS